MQPQSSTSTGPTCQDTTTCGRSRQHTHTHTQDFSVDLICGGFPCQDISVAGKGAGLTGERSGLWNDFARIIRTVRPRWVVIENVPALTARGLGTVLGDLAEIGFDAEWHCIPASAVGAPHRRERVWIVGNTRCEPIGGSITASALERGEAAAPASPVDTGDAGCGGTRSRSSNVADANSVRFRVPRRGEIAPATRGIKSETQERQRLWADAEPSRQGGDVPDTDCAGRQQQRRPESTPAEQLAAKRSGWWQSEPDVGRVAHGVPSRVDRLRCLGNAVVPQVVEVIGRAILDAEARMTA